MVNRRLILRDHRPKAGLLASSWQEVAKWLVDGLMPFSKVDGPRAPSENQVGQSFQDHSRFQGSLNSQSYMDMILESLKDGCFKLKGSLPPPSCTSQELECCGSLRRGKDGQVVVWWYLGDVVGASHPCFWMCGGVRKADTSGTFNRFKGGGLAGLKC